MRSRTLVDLCHLGGIDVVDDADFETCITMLRTRMLKNWWWERELQLGRIE